MPERDDIPTSFLGTGWSFPPAFAAGGAEIAMVSESDDIHQSLAILFATRPGERPMQESFGCNLDEFSFEELDHQLVSRVTSAIHDAILQYEPRIALRDVDVEPDQNEPGALRVQIEYAVLGTNSRYNMVFPFYLNEAVTPGL